MNRIPPSATRITPDAAQESYDPKNVIHGSPKNSVRVAYSNPSDVFSAGVWTSTEGKWAFSMSEHEEEFCYLLEGEVELTSEAGEKQVFRAGDAFVLPSGFKGTWETKKPLKKFFSAYEKKA